MIKQLRLAIFVGLLKLAVKVLPKDCIKTLYWFRDMPVED